MLDDSIVRFETISAMQARHSELLQRRRENGDLQGFLDDVLRFMELGQHTGKVLDGFNERETARTMIAFWATDLVRNGKELPDIALDDYDPTLAPKLPDEPCPYKGLEAFNSAEFFFGREAAVKSLIQLLTGGCRLLSVIGPSGSGKSSVVQGGLVPSLKAGALPGSSDWSYAIMAPGSDPVAALDSTLNSEAHKTQSVMMPSVLVVDQFEEVFTLASASARGTFEDRLVDLHSKGVVIVLTLRLDFASDDVAKLRRLHPLIEAGRVDLKALSIQELRDAILIPASRVGLKFEQGIVDDMVAKVLGERAGLPLLQFALLKLWENRDLNRITRQVYEKVGDPLQALNRSAESFYAALMPQEQATVRRILLKLVKPAGLSTEVTSSRMALHDIYRENDATDRVAAALSKLEHARLIRITGQGAQCEIAHEALIRNWPTLEQWLDEERKKLRERFMLAEKAQTWFADKGRTSALLRGRELEDSEQFTDLTDVEAAFVTASRTEVERAAREQEEARQRMLKRLRRLTAMSIIGSMVALVSLVVYLQTQSNFMLFFALCLQPLLGLLMLILALRWGVFSSGPAKTAGAVKTGSRS